MASTNFKFKIRSKKIQVVLDKILLIKLMRKLNGRFWGVFGLLVLDSMLLLCFYIQPELQSISTAFSDFGTYAKTAPYFTVGLLAGAYGLWRWRNYLSKASTRPGLVTLFLSFIIFGLYVVALTPLGINETVDTLHYIGFAFAGAGMIMTVTADTFLTRVKKNRRNKTAWQLYRFLNILLIIFGMTVTMLSADRFGDPLQLSLLGETLILVGFSNWVIDRTYQGEGVQSGFSKALDKVLIIN